MLLIVCMGLILAGVIFYTQAEFFLTYPYHKYIRSLPKDVAAESVSFSSLPGATLHGWYFPGKGRGVVMLLHGIYDDRRSMLPRARFLNKNGYSVLLFDFQAHGESTGDRMTFGYLESKDVKNAVQFVRDRDRIERWPSSVAHWVVQPIY